ncbi:MAG: hypothetical protein J6C23_04955 [Clostridia bacterium]|nr:hypothetical protein [Clostridia bacterium]
MLLQYSDTFTLTTNDFYYDKQIKLSAILNFFQTVAGDHADILGAGFDELLKKDIVWMLINVKCTIYKNLHRGDKITVTTIPLPKTRIGYIRDYYIYNENGELCIKGSSFWCHVSFSQRKILRPTFEYVGEFVDKRAYEEDFERLKPFPVSQNPTYVCKILNTHIDGNAHANNIKYADFAVDGLDEIPQISEFEIRYVSECKKGEELAIGYEKQDNIIYVCGENNGKTSFAAKITTK